MRQTWGEMWQMSVFACPPVLCFLWRSLHVYVLELQYVAHLRRFMVCWLEKTLSWKERGDWWLMFAHDTLTCVWILFFLLWPLAAVPAPNAAATCEAWGPHLSFSAFISILPLQIACWCVALSYITPNSFNVFSLNFSISVQLQNSPLIHFIFSYNPCERVLCIPFLTAILCSKALQRPQARTIWWAICSLGGFSMCHLGFLHLSLHN